MRWPRKKLVIVGGAEAHLHLQWAKLNDLFRKREKRQTPTPELIP